jgi:hypothetical protein
MRIKESYTHSLNIEIIHDIMDDYDEITVFKGLIKKLKKETKKSGFRRMFTAEEAELIDFLYNNVIKEEDEKHKDKGVPQGTGTEIQNIS